ncbi:MAG: SRPBCC domain-containing protein [Candidatus Limnocylindria bacterium]
MTSFTIQVDVPRERSSVFAALTDPRRIHRWFYGTAEITDVSGPLSIAGTTFVQRAIKGIERPGAVIAADPPRLWHVRLAGFGERADLQFELDEAEGGTRLSLAADIRNGPAILGPVVDRLTWRIDRRLWRRVLDQMQAEMARDAIVPVDGGVYVLDGGGRYRIGQVLDADDGHVHLELRPGVAKSRATSVEDVKLEHRRLKDYLDLRPLEPTVRSTASLVHTGADSLLADGGLGLVHMPMTISEFRNARPQLLAVTPVPNDATTRVTTWRHRKGAAFGEQRPPSVGGLFSVRLQAMGVESVGFGVVKLLRQQIRGVHVRVYSNTFAERPHQVEDASLESRAVDPSSIGDAPPSEPLAIRHLPLSHAAFRAWQPEFIRSAVVDPDELLGYEEWKLAKGGFF